MSQQIDSTAIQQIRDMVLLQQSGNEISFADCPIVALPESVVIKNLEPYSNHRSRFRGKMETASIEDFVRYSKGYAAEGSRCFINADAMRAASVFNLGTIAEPGHADNQAILSLKKTAPFDSLLNANGEKCSQKELAEWLEDWSDFIIGFSADGETIDAKKSAAAVRKITIEAIQSSDYEDSDFSGKRSIMESIEAKTKDIMPVSFEFKCVPYEGLSENKFSLRLSILTSGDRPALILRVVQLEAKKEELAKEFRDLLVNNFNETGVETFIGVFNA